MKTLKYRRNWAYEQLADVYFVDGHHEQCFCQTDNKGRINFITYDDTDYTPEEFDLLGIESVHYMTPAKLEVKTPVEILVDVYLRLAKEIPEAIDNRDAEGAIKKARIRSDIAEEIHKRGLNMQELISERV